MERADENALKMLKQMFDFDAKWDATSTELANLMKAGTQSGRKFNKLAEQTEQLIDEREYCMAALKAWHETGEDPLLWVLSNPKTF